MGLAIRMAVTVTPPVLTGVLVWWGVMLAGPVVLIWRWRRRRRAAPRRRLWPSAARTVGAVSIIGGWISERRCGARPRHGGPGRTH